MVMAVTKIYQMKMLNYEQIEQIQFMYPKMKLEFVEIWIWIHFDDC